MNRTFVILVVLIGAFSLLAIPFGFAASEESKGDHQLHVSVRLIEPFVMDKTNHYAGFSIDLWEALARRLHVNYDYVLHNSVHDQLQSVSTGKVDLAISAISATADREKVVDLTHPYFDYGLQILVPAHHPHSLIEVLDPLNAPALVQLLEIALTFALLQAHIIYLAERGSNPKFQHGYLKGIWEGFWWLSMIVATGEYGEKDTPHPFKRMVTICMWLLGVCFIAAFTATVTSNLTQHDLAAGINSPDDLIGKRVVTIAESAPAHYLTNHKIPFIPVWRLEDAYALLKTGKADAIVYSGPVLQYYASHQGKGTFKVTGQVFDHASNAIALPLGSSLRKPINELILEFYQDGTLDEINKKWFGLGD